MTERKWYFLSKSGVATLCADKEDALEQAKRADWLFKTEAPHRVCQIVPVYESDGMAQAGTRLASLITRRDKELGK